MQNGPGKGAACTGENRDFSDAEQRQNYPPRSRWSSPPRSSATLTHVLDHLTVLTAVDRARLTKIHSRQPDGSFLTKPYDRCFMVAVKEMPIAGLVDLARALDHVALDPHRCIIRGQPLPDIDRQCCRRLYLPHIEDDGSITQPSFEPAARRWLGIDFDTLPTPGWDPEQLVARREAIARDRAEHPIALPRKGPSDGEDFDFDADGDPAPIDPVRDWGIVTRFAIEHLPPEFHNAHCWAQLTSSAGLAQGVRIRLWYWLSRPVSDAEAKRWLKAAPVDLSLYTPVQPHYVAAPIFEPQSSNPVARRSWIWWRWQDAVAVPDLPEPEPPPIVERKPLVAPSKRARSYAEAILKGIANAPDKQRHTTMRAGAITLYAMAENGLLDPADVTSQLNSIGRAMTWPERRLNDLLVWCRAAAIADPSLPKGFEP